MGVSKRPKSWISFGNFVSIANIFTMQTENSVVNGITAISHSHCDLNFGPQTVKKGKKSLKDYNNSIFFTENCPCGCFCHLPHEQVAAELEN